MNFLFFLFFCPYNEGVATSTRPDFAPKVTVDSKNILYCAYEIAMYEQDHGVAINFKPSKEGPWYPRWTYLAFPPEDNRNPSITAGPGDTVYLVCEGPCPLSDVGSQFHWYALSDSAGEWIVHYLPESDWSLARNPDIKATELGDLYIVYEETGSIKGYFVSQGSVSSFIVEAENSKNPLLSCAGGTAFVAFESNGDIYGSILMQATPGLPVRVVASESKERLCSVFKKGDNVYVGFERDGNVYLALSTDGGNSFQEKPVDEGEGRASQIAVTALKNKIFAAYWKEDNNIHLKESYDNGDTWNYRGIITSKPTAVDTPRVVILPYGEDIYCLWVDERGGGLDIYGTYLPYTSGIKGETSRSITKKNIYFTDKLKIPFDNIKLVKVYDAAGKLICIKHVNQRRFVDLSEISEGVYFIDASGYHIKAVKLNWR